MGMDESVEDVEILRVLARVDIRDDRQIVQVEAPAVFGPGSITTRAPVPRSTRVRGPARPGCRCLLPHCMSPKTTGSRSRPFAVKEYSSRVRLPASR